MTGKPTEKMVWSLVNRFGFPVEMVNTMTYEQASNIISNRITYEEPSQTGGQYTKTVYTPQIETAQKQFNRAKPTYNPSSQYVSYAKDLFMYMHAALIESSKGEISNEMIMTECLKLVDQAIKHYDHKD